MPNLVVIFGPPAVGKAAIGHLLAELTGYRFFHNHLTRDAAAAVLGWNSPRLSDTVFAMRELLFREAAADCAIPGVIFTFVWGLDVPEDHDLMIKATELFRHSGGRVLFVELRASLEARLAREGTPFRLSLKPSHRDVDAARQRQREVAALYRMNTDGAALPLDYPHMVIDTEAVVPHEAARQIQATLSALHGACALG